MLIRFTSNFAQQLQGFQATWKTSKWLIALVMLKIEFVLLSDNTIYLRYICVIMYADDLTIYIV